MEFKASSEDIARICHAHPSLSEATKEAALAGRQADAELLKALHREGAANAGEEAGTSRCFPCGLRALPRLRGEGCCMTVRDVYYDEGPGLPERPRAAARGRRPGRCAADWSHYKEQRSNASRS
jgi:hypothetical protein